MKKTTQEIVEILSLYYKLRELGENVQSEIDYYERFLA